MRFIRTGWPQTNDGPRHSVSGVAYAQRRSAERAIPGSMWDDGAHGQLSKRSQIYLNPGNIPPVVFLDNHTILYLDVPLAPPRARRSRYINDKLWEQAILQGYEVFRQLRDNQGGIVVGDREARSISYRVN